MTVGEMETVDTVLQRLSAKAEEWYNLDNAKKLTYLDAALEKYASVEGLLLEGAAHYAQRLRNSPPGTEEYDYLVAEDFVVQASQGKDQIKAAREAFRVMTGQSQHASILTQLETRTTASGQIAAKVFPLLPEDKNGPAAQRHTEVWFQKKHISRETDVQTLDYPASYHPEPAVSVVLGAGNYPNLTVVDVLVQLFQKNTVVFLKHHPARAPLDKVIRHVFRALYEDGFIDSEVHVSTERCQQIVYHPTVKLVHMTGGKPTHDAIVWGSSTPSSKPQLKLTNAKMTSELGAVTPYIIVPFESYTQAELDHQAQVILSARWFNGSASCNAPQAILMSEDWKHRDEFVRLLEHYWTKKIPAPVVYYPGSKEKWQACHDAYPPSQRKVWMGPTPPASNGMASKANHMPLLVVQLEVDLSTEEGQKALAKQDHVLKNEAFAPVLALVTLKTCDGPQAFVEQVVPFCNNHMYGTLSCSVLVPPEKIKEHPYIEKAFGDLRYGAVVVNTWAAQAYGVPYGTWGGAPGEDLANIESGIGLVNNFLSLQHVDKSVVVKPLIDSGNLLATKPRAYQTRLYMAAGRMFLNTNVTTVVALILALMGSEMQAIVGGVLASLTAAFIAFQLRA